MSFLTAQSVRNTKRLLFPVSFRGFLVSKPCSTSSTAPRSTSTFYKRRLDQSGSQRLLFSTARSPSAASTDKTIHQMFSFLDPSERPWHSERFMAHQSAQAKEDWLQNLLKTSEGNDSAVIQSVDREAFLVVLRALAVSGMPDAPMRAERLIRKLEQLASVEEEAKKSSSTGDQGETELLLQPTPECYQRVIECWSNAVREDIRISVVRAEKMLQPGRRTNTATINAFLDLCTKGRSDKKIKKIVNENAEKAENILRHMIKDRETHGEASEVAPNLDSFNFVIRGWTRCRKFMGVADRTIEAVRLLENYHRNVDSSVRPDIKSYSMLMDALICRAKLVVGRCVREQNPYDFSNAEYNGQQELQQIMSVLKELHQREEDGETRLAPTTVCYNLLISCWATLSAIDEHGPYEAEKIILQMNRFREQGHAIRAPDAFSYQYVMRAWLNSEHETREARVVWLLKKLKQDYEIVGDEQLRPNTAVYNLVIRALAAASKPKEAEQLLSEMLKSYEQEPISTCKPNSETFHFVIAGWVVCAKEGSKSALIKAREWLDILSQFEKSGVGGFQTQPGQYFSIIQASYFCAAVQPEVLDIAMDTFDMLRGSHHEVHCLAYAHLLRTGLRALSRPENDHVRNAFVQELIKECADMGLVGKPVVRALTNGPTFYKGWTSEESERLTAEMFPKWPFPPSWTRNIKQEGFWPEEDDLERTNVLEVSELRH